MSEIGRMTSTGTPNLPPTGAEEKTLAAIPGPQDRFDFSDGVNSALEIALLPTIDQVLGGVTGDQLQQGNLAIVEGSITREDNPEYKESINLRMAIDTAKNEYSTDGSYGKKQQDEPVQGTFVKEKGVEDMVNMKVVVSGYIGTHTPTGESPINENLEIIPRMGTTLLQGKLDNYDIQENLSIDLATPAIIHQGNIAGVNFQRGLKIDIMGNATIYGRFGEFQESGTVTKQNDGSVNIERKIGPYIISEKVKFTYTPPTPPPPAKD